MTKRTQHAERVLLMLDLAEENQLEAGEILDLRGKIPSTKEFKATDFGAVRSGRGWCAEHARGYSEAIQAMITSSRPYIGRHTEVLIAGRANLASYAQLGLRVSGWNGKTTLINRRKDLQWAFCTIDGADDDGKPYFDQVHFPGRDSDETGRVAVVISSGYRVRHELIEDLFDQEGEDLLSVVTLQATPPEGATCKDISVKNTPGLARTLNDELGKIQLQYPGQRGLAIFVAGPVQLAFLAGRAINPNVYSSVWLTHKEGDRYVIGSMVPWVDKVRVRMLMASPNDQSPIDPNGEEETAAATVLDQLQARERFHFSVKHAATYHDLFEVLMHDRPQIVHFSGHGKEDALGFVSSRGDRTDIVPAEALEEAMRSASDPINPPRLVILNACKSEKQAKACTNTVDFAIGMKPNIKDSRAVAFTRRFYDALAAGRTLRNAFDQAKAYVTKWGPVSRDAPQLFCRPGCDPEGARFVEP